jgi:UDP-N-acetylmuramate dehydrogenase
VAVASLCARGAPLVVVGGGFNLLARDGAFARGRQAHRPARAGAARRRQRLRRGGRHARQLRACADHGRAGLEFAVGIPGTVGGWIAMNAGIRGREMGRGARGRAVRPAAGASPDAREGRARLPLPRHGAAGRERGRVGALTTETGAKAAIRAEQKQLLAQRRATQPVDQPSCGSVFVNPPGDFAGRLIEAAGLKGSAIGGARISELHANFIVTGAGARAADVLALIARAQAEVKARFGVELEPEVRTLGVDA